MTQGSSTVYSAQYGTDGNMYCRAASSSSTCEGSTFSGARMSYEHEGRLVSRQNTWSNPTATAAYAYDGAGQRVAQSVTSGSPATTSTTYYVGGGLEELTVSGASSTLTKYEAIPGVCNVVIVGTGPSESISYVTTDGLGSVSEALDGSGHVTAQQLYGPYGGGRYQSGTMPTAKGFTGQYADAASSGLDYYNARYYDPLLGQFTSADTDAKGGLNRYAYVADDPETATDPTGHRYCTSDGSSCSSKVGGGSGGSSGSTGGTSGGSNGGTSGGGGGHGHRPIGNSTSSCDGVVLVGKCFSLDAAEIPGQRLKFVDAWFTQFAAGWGTAEEAFMAWMFNSKRLRNSPFWQGVDGDLIFDMWTAAVEFVAGMRTTSNQIIEHWLSFMAAPSAAGFWQAHNTSIMASAWSADGLAWFHAESLQEQLLINDALVNLLEGTFATTLAGQFADAANAPGWLRNIAHGCDPSTNCIGIYLYVLYPTTYPVSWAWFMSGFGAADTAFACQNAVMPITC